MKPGDSVVVPCTVGGVGQGRPPVGLARLTMADDGVVRAQIHLYPDAPVHVKTSISGTFMEISLGDLERIAGV